MLAPIQLRAFSPNLVAEFGNTPPAHYLHDYLAEIGARSVLFEPHYVDRHYLDEYAQYYATSFVAPKPHCSRYHFFTSTPEELDASLTRAFGGAHEEVEREIEDGRLYLGFAVRRPLSAAMVGRTVLRTYPHEGRRRYEAGMRRYRVNACGLSLRVDGLAYQQQDGGAAVCASVALWTALQSVAEQAGNRSPTPIAITKASGTPYPAGAGLFLPEMAAAISNLGYLAETFDPGTNRAQFRAMIVACLESRLPVILLLYQKQVSAAEPDAGDVTIGHAIALSGYSDSRTVIDVPPTLAAEGTAIPMRGGATQVVYAHDDNLGFHAHYEFEDVDERNEIDHRILRILRGRSDQPPPDWWKPDRWDVVSALVCKPPKLRTSFKELLADIRLVRPMLEQTIFVGLQLHYSARFTSGARFRAEVLRWELDPVQRKEFQTSVTLPRHIGVVSAYCGDRHVCDVVLDASQVRRNPGLPLLALVAPGAHQGSRAWIAMQTLKKIGIPIATAPASPPAPPGGLANP